MVMGYKIELLNMHTQQYIPRTGMCSSQEQHLVENTSKMLSKGTITKLPLKEANNGFYWSLFLIPKKDEGMRAFINSKSLNKYVVPQQFKTEGIHTLKDLLKEATG